MVTNNSSDYSPTQYNVQTGGANGTLNNVVPSATSGVPVISQGSSSQPVFGTAVVAGGGTGDTSFTAYSVITGGTTSTGALQNVSGVGTSGQVLTSNGASALPTWQAAGGGSGFTTVVTQVFTGSGTYTPTASMKYCIIELCGGGAGGGGAAASSAGQFAIGGGGGAGGYASKTVAAATIGASQTVTVGGGGAGGTAGANTGTGGGTTSVGSIVSATGGSGGVGGAAFTASGFGSGNISTGGVGGAGSSGIFNLTGGSGSPGTVSWNTVFSTVKGGVGGNSFFGQGGAAVNAPVANGGLDQDQIAGVVGYSYGAGGSGGCSVCVASSASSSVAGGDGVAGIVVITEYI